MLLYEDLTYKIRKAIFNVYNYWGPGLLEQVYGESLVVELASMGMKVERQKEIPLLIMGQSYNATIGLTCWLKTK